MASHNELGQWGEEQAVNYLEGKGYRILERDWRSGHRDIDIIARTTAEIVFVEVKTRRTSRFGSPCEAVDYRKRRHLQEAINHYIRSRQIDMPFRFDIISITAADPGHPRIEHFEDVRLLGYGGFCR